MMDYTFFATDLTLTDILVNDLRFKRKYMNRKMRTRKKSRRRISYIKRSAIFSADFWTKPRILIAAGALLAIIIAVVLICTLSGGKKDISNITDEELFAMEYPQGISVEGVDVSGMLFTDAAEKVLDKANELLDELVAKYIIEDETYYISAYDMGAKIDYAATMKEAMFGEKGDYPLDITVDNNRIATMIKANCELHNVEAKNAMPSLDVDSSEETLVITSDLVITEEVTGKEVDTTGLAKKIAQAVGKRDEEPSVADITETQPEWTKEFIEENMSIMGEYTTYFKDSAYGRRYNIWKMSDVVCGVVIMPGETWSINEAAGDRTTENGWKDAAGIVNGAYVDEPGGGICQVSTTLYNAAIRSELTIVERSHHSWPLKYAPVGLDATISTGKPDFVISNPYDTPIVLAVRLDANSEGEKSIRVRVYGPPMDYKLDFTSEVVKEVEPEPAATTADPSLSPGKSKEVSPRHNALTVNVYKHTIDKATGEEMEKTLYKTEYYAAFRGTIAYGPEKSEEPTSSGDIGDAENSGEENQVKPSPAASTKPA